MREFEDKPYTVRTNMRRWDGENFTTNIQRQITFATSKEAEKAAEELNRTHKHLLTPDDLFFYASFK